MAQTPQLFPKSLCISIIKVHKNHREQLSRKMNLLDASIEVSLLQRYRTKEFAASGGVLNPKRE